MLQVSFSRQAEKFLLNIFPKHAKQIARKIMELRINPRPSDSKKLKEKKSSLYYMRSDIGEYRIIYRVEDNVLIIFVIGKRNDDAVYKVFKRKV